MSSYFVNSLFSKYKSGDSLRPNYYECGFAQDLAGSRPTVVYGPGSGATFQHAPQIQDFYHHSASTLPANPYQQSPCAVTCHGEPGNFYGYDALQRQTLFGAQDADLVQYSDCKLGGAQGLGGDDAEGTEQSPSPTQLFPWMRPQGEDTGAGWRCFVWVTFWLQPRVKKVAAASAVVADSAAHPGAGSTERVGLHSGSKKKSCRRRFKKRRLIRGEGGGANWSSELFGGRDKSVFMVLLAVTKTCE